MNLRTWRKQYLISLADGGRAHFGLGSIIKKIGKAAKSAVKSPLGKAAILGMAGWGIPGTDFKGLIGGGGGLGSFFGKGSFSPFKAMIGQGTADVGFGPSGLGKFLGSKFVNQATGALTGLGWGAGAVGLGMGAQMFENMQPDEIKALRNNPEALRAYLTEYHSNTNPEKSEKEVDLWVEQNMYSTGGRVGFAERGTIKDMTISDSQRDPKNMTTLEIISIIKGGKSTPEMFEELRLRGIEGVDEIALAEGQGDVGYSFDEKLVDEYNPKTGTAEESFLMKMRESNPDVYGKYNKPREHLPIAEPKNYPENGFVDEPKWMKAQGGRIGYSDRGVVSLEQAKESIWNKREDPGRHYEMVEKPILDKLDYIYSLRPEAQVKLKDEIKALKLQLSGDAPQFAQGGRIGFAFGPDQTAEAAGIMGQLPVRKNDAGVKELDLRDSGGFIPPVGVKEKADDIPAMLSNNEFVFTADAVRGCRWWKR